MNPIRMCICCKKRQEKHDLIRIISNEKNEAMYDNEQKINSRAIYICSSKECIDKAINLIEKRKLILKISVNNNSLINVLKHVENELGE